MADPNALAYYDILQEVLKTDTCKRKNYFADPNAQAYYNKLQEVLKQLNMMNSKDFGRPKHSSLL